ncbi:MAG TPA: DUF2231 domain-containing protein [Candidatus Eisenbacteria bacterium]|nr:DUF2231 domain-containing protein [Candidatus Eisenbacteria bacterium]
MQNPHPLFVHFPLGLLVTAVLCEAVFAFTRRPLADTLSRWLLYAGALGAAAAALTGWLASLSVAPVARAAGDLVDHRTFGFLSLGTAAVLAFWRWGTSRAGGPKPRWLFLAGMLGLLGLLVTAGLEGGELVYEHGVGTELTAPGGPLREAHADSSKKDVPRSSDFR